MQWQHLGEHLLYESVRGRGIEVKMQYCCSKLQNKQVCCIKKMVNRKEYSYKLGFALILMFHWIGTWSWLSLWLLAANTTSLVGHPLEHMTCLQRMEYNVKVVVWLLLIFANCPLVVVVLLHCCHHGHYYSSHWLTGLGLDCFLVDLVHLKDGLPLYCLGWPCLSLWLDHHLWHPVSLLHCCFCSQPLLSCKWPFHGHFCQNNHQNYDNLLLQSKPSQTDRIWPDLVWSLSPFMPWYHASSLMVWMTVSVMGIMVTLHREITLPVARCKSSWPPWILDRGHKWRLFNGFGSMCAWTYENWVIKHCLV